MTKKDLIIVLEAITDITDTEKRLIILDFFMQNGPFFNERFNRDVFKGRYCKMMEEKGK